MNKNKNTKYKKTLTYANSVYSKNKLENGMENKYENNFSSILKKTNFLVELEKKNSKNINRRNSMFSNIKIIEEKLIEENEYDENINNFFFHKYKSSCEENYKNDNNSNSIHKKIDKSHLDPRDIKSSQIKKHYAYSSDKYKNSRKTDIYKKKNPLYKGSVIYKNSKDFSKSFILNNTKSILNDFVCKLRNTLGNNDKISLNNNDLYTQQMYGEKNSETRWKNDTTKNVWETLKLIKKKVKTIKNKKKNELKKAIKLNNEEFINNELKSEEFKKIYRNKDNLFPSDKIIQYIIKYNRFKMLENILEDEAYQYNYDYIFDYIYNIIQPKEFKTKRKKMPKSQKNVNELKDSKDIKRRRSKLFKKMKSYSSNHKKLILENLIKNKLYPYNQIEKVKILAWFFCNYQYDSIFKILINDNIVYFLNNKKKIKEFNYKQVYIEYNTEKINFLNTIEYCLKYKFQNLAICFLEKTKNISNQDYEDISKIAAENENLDFLKFLWEKDLDNILKKKQPSVKSNNISLTTNILNNQNFINSTKNIKNYLKKIKTEFNPKFSITNVIDILVEIYKKKIETKGKNVSTFSNLNKILTWKHINLDSSFIESLFKNNLFEQISIIINKWPWSNFSNQFYFETVINGKNGELILYYLKKKDCLRVLTFEMYQKKIVEDFIAKGDKIYYGAEMLQYIYKNQWNKDLTKNLCKNIMKTIKTKEILNCHSPILTSLLLIEFVNQIKQDSITNAISCEKVINELKIYCKSIQDSNQEESYLNYLMKQKDTKGRNSFQIACQNDILILFENPEIGTIVKKMWDGTINNNGFQAASSMHRYLIDDKKPADPFSTFDELDKNKVYFFQLIVWIDSCSLRYYPIVLSHFATVVIYNCFIWLLASYGEILNNYSELSYKLKILIVCYLFLMTGQFFSNILYFIFMIIKKKKKKKKKLKKKIEEEEEVDDEEDENEENNGALMNLSFFSRLFQYICSWLILVDTKKIAAEYNYNQNLNFIFHSIIYDLQIPILKEVKEEVETYITSKAFMIRVFILSINDIIAWFRFFGVLFPFKEIGPVLIMILSMGKLLVKYILIIVLFLICCASIFTAIFGNHSNQFRSLVTSIITLFGGFLNDFDLRNYEDNYKEFGSVILMIYISISSVLLVNLLIAILSNEYENRAKMVNATHRSVLIQYYKQNKWDEEYGYLIFLSPPFCLINLIVWPFKIIFKKESKIFNIYITRLYYLLFYFPLIIIIFTLYTILLVPLCYIKGIITMIRYQSELKTIKIKKFFNIFKWFFIGIFFLFFIYLRDIFLCFRYVFEYPKNLKQNDLSRIHNNITNKDIVIFLKFIHSLKENDKKDIHSLFMSYLQYEESKKLNEKLKKKSEYLKKVENEKTEIKKFIFYDNNKNVVKKYTSIIRKNLMILEFLENFIVVDEHGNEKVEIDIMKKLFPLTMKIKNNHLRRLLYHNIHSVYLVITKLNSDKDNFQQYQIINKIISSAQKLDKDIDTDISKLKRNTSSFMNKLSFIHSKFKNNSNSEDEINEELLKKNESKEENNKNLKIMKNYEILLKEISANVQNIINTKKEEGISSVQSRQSSIISQGIKQLTNRTLLSQKELKEIEEDLIKCASSRKEKKYIFNDN